MEAEHRLDQVNTVRSTSSWSELCLVFQFRITEKITSIFE